MASFWEAFKPFAPGLLQTGLDIYGQKRAGRQQQQLLQQARGPLYDTQQQMAGQSLALARGTDPKEMAAERFAAQQALLEPGNERDMQELMTRLQRQGMLGLSSFAPVPGTVATPGQPLHPQIAALLAAQQGAKARSAYESLGEGEAYLDRLMGRSGMLQGQARGAQASGVQAVQNKLMAPKPKITDILLKGGSRLFQDPSARSGAWNALKSVPGMFGFGGINETVNPDYRAFDYF